MADEKPIDTLSRVSGIPKPEMLAIWEQVKANHAKLEACVGPHDFISLIDKPRYYICTKCGGELESINVQWYRDGLDHGRMEPRR